MRYAYLRPGRYIYRRVEWRPGVWNEVEVVKGEHFGVPGVYLQQRHSHNLDYLSSLPDDAIVVPLTPLPETDC